jgi:hypothetical protein
MGAESDRTTPGGRTVTANTDFDTRHGEHIPHIPVDLTKPLDLQIHNRSGDITVRAVERSDAFIVADDGYFGSGDDSTFMVGVEQNQIRIQSAPGHGAGWPGMSGDIDAFVGQITKAFRRGGPSTGFKPGRARAQMGHAGDADITVEIPRAMNGRIEIHNTSGEVRVEGFSGDVQLTTVSGDLRLVGIRGDLTLQTASGDVMAEGGSGRVTARTTSGDIRIESAQCESFHLQTANGDIAVDALLGTGTFQAQTANGDVHLTLRQRAGSMEESTTLTFRGVSGEAHVSPPFRKIDQRRWQMGEGNGGRLIEVMTVAGDLMANVAPATRDFAPAPTRPTSPIEAPTAPLPPEPPAAPLAPVWRESDSDITAPLQSATPASGLSETDRLAVLEAVERGEIDVEEALRRLEAADTSTSYGNE